MAALGRFFASTLGLCILALILSIVNLSVTTRCGTYSYLYYCDNTMAVRLKIANTVLFVVALIHTIVNMVVVSKAQTANQTAPTSNPSGFQ